MTTVQWPPPIDRDAALARLREVRAGMEPTPEQRDVCADLVRQVCEGFERAGRIFAEMLTKLSAGLRSAGRALMRAFGLRTLHLRSVRRTMRRATGPVTRAERVARRTRRRYLTRGIREARRG